MDLRIEELKPGDWERMCAIYAQGIASGDSTFEVATPSWLEWDRDHLSAGRLVARIEGGVVGWAALMGVSNRAVYVGVAEVSVYVDEDQKSRGIGGALMQELIRSSESAGIWTLQAGIFPENKASLALHSRHGFREVGVRERLGQLHDKWRDVILVERRSSY